MSHKSLYNKVFISLWGGTKFSAGCFCSFYFTKDNMSNIFSFLELATMDV